MQIIVFIYFFPTEPTRSTPHLCGIVLTMGLVMGHTLLLLLAFPLMIPNWYHNTTPPFFTATLRPSN